MSARGTQPRAAVARSAVCMSCSSIRSMRRWRSPAPATGLLRMRTIGASCLSAGGAGEGRHLPRQPGLVAGGRVAVDDPLAERAIDDRQGRPERLPRSIGVLARQELPEPLHLVAQTAPARAVDRVPSEALAPVLDGRFDPCHERALLAPLTGP